MSHRICRVVVEPSGWQTAITAASRQAGRETGGILLGWRHTEGVYVSQFIEIEDRHATRTGYLRRHAPATKQLEESIGELSDGSPIGYVGEWHTHPARVSPSRTDRSELKRISKNRHADIALIVAVYDPGVAEWVPLGLCARSGRVRLAVVEMGTLIASDPTPNHPQEQR